MSRSRRPSPGLVVGLLVGLLGLVASACLARFEVGQPDATTVDATTPGDTGETGTSGGISETGTSGATTSEGDGDSDPETGVMDCGDACDPELEQCVAGTCECRVGFEPCAGLCVDLRNDPNNCGACGESCDQGVCEDSQCQMSCAEKSECDGACVELDSNPLHCGDCNTPCLGTELCIESTCVGYVMSDCMSDLDCGAGSCCEFEESGGANLICVNGDQCP